MEEKLKESIIANALERAEIRQSLVLWKYLPIIAGIFESTKDVEPRDTLIMTLLDEIAVEAYRHGRNMGSLESSPEK